MSDPLPPLAQGLIMLWAPSAYILMAFFSLMQFKIFFTVFTNLCTARVNVSVWRQTVQPVLKRVLSTMESTFGPATKFTPGLTHILLVAVMLVMLTVGERIVSASQRRSSR